MYGWLGASAIAKDVKTPKVDWLSFSVTVKAAEDLLQTRYAWCVNRFNGNEATMRALWYSSPVKLRGKIRVVQLVTLFATRWEKR